MTIDALSSVDELPLVLKMYHIQKVLQISRTEAYKLPHIKGFPAVRIGRSIRVPKAAFFRWLAQQAGVQEDL